MQKQKYNNTALNEQRISFQTRLAWKIRRIMVRSDVVEWTFFHNTTTSQNQTVRLEKYTILK